MIKSYVGNVKSCSKVSQANRLELERLEQELDDNYFDDKIPDDAATLACKMKAHNPFRMEPMPQEIHNTLCQIDTEKGAESQLNGASTNPFRNVPEEELSSDQEDNDLSAECRMNNFIERIQCREAVPEYALSDAVFNVDKPIDAVAHGVELPVLPLSDQFVVGNLMILSITEVYSPFQFWFHEVQDSNMLIKLNYQIKDFYSSACDMIWRLPPYFMKPGYMCAVRQLLSWRRARIVDGPSTADKQVSVYFVDYGTAANVPSEDLYFLHKCFMEQPALVRRGTLTDVYPLDLHWPSNVTATFRHMVGSCELHACIKDVDVDERILFLNLWNTNDRRVTISSELINAGLAGSSRNYSDETRAAYNGRRLRYVRERLPTFDMLELQLFATESEEFEDRFDDIIYKPEFLRDFERPIVENPFRRGLQEALINWLAKFKPVELAWRKLQQQSKKQSTIPS